MVRVETPISSANWDVVAQVALRVARRAGTAGGQLHANLTGAAVNGTTARALLRFDARQPPPPLPWLADGQHLNLPLPLWRMVAHQQWAAPLPSKLPRQGFQLAGAGVQPALAQRSLAQAEHLQHQAIAAGGTLPLPLWCGQQQLLQRVDQFGRKARIRIPRALSTARALRSKRRQVSRLMFSREAICTWVRGVGVR